MRNAPFLFATNNTERMRIAAAGEVGIGTSSPSSMLHVFGTNPVIHANGDSNSYYPGVKVTGLNGSISLGTYYGGNISGSTNLVFLTGAGNPDGGTERVRINSTGQLLVNATTDAAGAGGRLHITGADSQTAASLRIGTNGYPGWYFANASGSKVGDIVINSGGTAYNTTSDYRLKENIAPMTGALARVSALKPVTYSWKSDGSAGEGFIAHELQAIVPEAVTGEKDAVNADGSIKPQGIDTSFLVATLTAAIQEQQALIENLTTRLNALEGK
jgi:hypothetical protein